MGNQRLESHTTRGSPRLTLPGWPGTRGWIVDSSETCDRNKHYLKQKSQ